MITLQKTPYVTVFLGGLLSLLLLPSLAKAERPIIAGPNANSSSASRNQKMSAFQYPNSRRDNTEDSYHGTKVTDPYRWLEDTESEETANWVEAQNKVTFDYLRNISTRQPIVDRLTSLWNYERFGRPFKRGDFYFYSHNNGLQNQSVLYVTNSLESEARVLLDPNQWSQEGTKALSSYAPSPNGKLMAYSISSAGSDWREWHVLNVETGEKLDDHIQWSKFSSASWANDNSGFYYSRYDEPKEGEEFSGTNYFQKLYFHKIGTSQSEDQLIYQRADQKEWGFGGYVTEDGNYLIISVWKGSDRKNQLFYKDLTKADAKVVELISGFDADYDFIGNDRNRFWILTDLDAPQKRVVEIDLNEPSRNNWQTLIEEAEHRLESISNTGGHFIVQYLQDAQNRVYVFAENGSPIREVELPGVGSTSGFGGKRAETETFYSFTNYVTPTRIYRYNIETGESELYKEPDVVFAPDHYETKQVFVTSKDGTKVPMFVTSKKGLKLNGKNPTILYGYGGFDISLTPGFSVANLVWLEMGGIYAVANLRGGGEYGLRWHEAGMRDNKQNVFDDFISCAEWLQKEKYTNTSNLAIRGGSNGGLLVGACITQRPDLFGAAIPAVGVMDMLRYHKFTIGWAWVGEYGSSDEGHQFNTLIKYSPLHNLRPGTNYPPTMVTTADHDDRVVPGHSFKFAAQLQHCHQGKNPVLIRIEESAGHGAGTPTSKRIDAAADVFAFLTEVLKNKRWTIGD
jgi:prolyl oligopeptidase